MMARHVSASLVLTGALLAGPALAGQFTPPPGCAARMSLQMRACLVAHYYSCAADGPGQQWSVIYDSDGPFFAARVDAEYQWLESVDLPGGARSLLVAGAPDPASFSQLLATGEDSYDFTTEGEDGSLRRYQGYDRLTGDSVTIDGIALLATAFEMTETDPTTGAVMARRWGNQYVHRDWRLFFSGAESFSTDQGSLPMDASPRDFIFPGEPGYLSTVPLYDCDALMSALPGAAQPMLPAQVPHG